MHKKYISFVLFICSFVAFSHTPSSFVENKGQLQTQQHLPNPAVKYIFNARGMNVQLRSSGFSYDTYTLSHEGGSNSKLLSKTPAAPLSYHFHRIDVEFINANPSPEIIAEQPAGLINYGNIHSIRSFQKIIYKNLYPNTDLEFISNGSSVKYNFILHPGADISAIRWMYKGASSQGLGRKAIVIGHSNGTIREVIPESYIQSAHAKKNISVSFVQRDGVYSFRSKANPAANETLVIDPSPVLDWGTYYGSSGNEAGTSTAIDPSGNVVLAGSTDSPANIATSGVYQSTFGGSTDAFVVKFDNSGNRQWCTYFGGAGDDVVRSVTTNTLGLVYIAGQTTSTAAISVGPVHQTSFGGLYDAFIAKFDVGGIIIWSTYYGGTGYEDGTSIALDANDNAYITGYTDSPNAMVSGGAHQTAFGGIYDAYLAKFDPNGTRLWGTYYGGSADDYGLAATVDNTGNIFFAGQTSSTGAMASPGAHQTVLGGNDDAFLAKFNTNGVRQWATYMGDVPNETAFGACTDPSGNVYMCGQTSSSVSIATAGVMQPNLSAGGPDGFIVKFSTAGTQLWGTYYGDSGSDVANAMLADGSGVVITGKTNSAINMTSTNSQQQNFGGFNDAFLLKLTLNGVRQWATYYGGSGDDSGNGVARDGAGKYFMAGTTASSLSISTPGAYQTVKDASYDAFLARFSNGCFNPTSPANSTSAANLSVCSGSSAVLSASGTGTIGWYDAASGGNYLGGGTPFTTSILTAPTPSTVTFYAQDSTVCGASLGRTAITVSINPTPTVSFTLPNADTLVCSSHLAFTLNGNSPGGGTFSGTGVSGSVFTPSVAGIGTYTITYMVTLGSCTNTAQSVIRVKNCAGIEEYELMNALVNIYPNPNNGSFRISGTKEGAYLIINNIGQTVRTIRVNASNGFSENAGGLAPGIYFICGTGENSGVRKKIVVE